MVDNRHINSKRITILRKGTFMEGAQTGAAEFMSMSKKSIGSYFESKSGKGIGCGLSFEERELLMPRIIDIPKEDRGFLPGVKAFFESLVTHVPYEHGVELEIGLTIDNKLPITFWHEAQERFNLPIAPMDYIRYRHAQKHPRVSPSVQDAKGNMLVDFYIYDPASTLVENVELSNTKDKALKIYMKLREERNPEKIDMMLTLMEKDPREFTGIGKDDEKAEFLRNAADTRAVDFVAAHEGKHFEEEYLLRSMLNVGVVRQIGNQFINKETGKIIGNTREEALYFFKDPVHSDQISILKAQMQEALKVEIKVNKNKRLPVGVRR